MIRNTDIAEPHIVIIDLGLAQAAAGPGLAGGTLGYRPPETNATNIWYPKGDIFSLGVTFFQLLANKVPDERTGQLGIFQEGATCEMDIVRFTATRPVPVNLIHKYPGTLSWLPRMMDKQRKNRMVSMQMLTLRWFEANARVEKQQSGRQRSATDQSISSGCANDQAALSPMRELPKAEQPELSGSPDFAKLDEPQLLRFQRAMKRFKFNIETNYGTLRAAFLHFDKERKGSLNLENFSNALTLHGVDFSPMQIELAWSMFDKRGAGMLSFPDFCAAMNERPALIV